MWSDASIWPNRRLPAPGSNVVLPANRRVVLSGCAFANNAATFASIVIPPSSQVGSLMRANT